jgi:hypothetical protein
MEVFDPPMCCSTGLCGPSVDPVLPRFAADLEWLKAHGVPVDRFNLAQQPDAFAKNEIVKRAMAEGESKTVLLTNFDPEKDAFGETPAESKNCLPLILVSGRIVSRGVYPSREELAAFIGITAEDSLPQVDAEGEK